MRKLTVEEEERCKISLAQNLHEHMLSNRDEWLILGDETGGLKEFEGQNPHRPSRMIGLQFHLMSLFHHCIHFIMAKMPNGLKGKQLTH